MAAILTGSRNWVDVRAVEEMRYLMVAAQRGSKRMFTLALRPLGVTLAQAEALRLLDRREPLTLSGLGELLLYASGGNASRLVDQLVTNGLVHRVTAVCDRRRVDITLTAAGRRLARQIGGIEDRIYENLDAVGEGHDVAAVIAYLRAVVAGTRRPQDRPLTGTGGSPEEHSRGAELSHIRRDECGSADGTTCPPCFLDTSSVVCSRPPSDPI